MIGFVSGRILTKIGDQILVKTPSGIGYLLHTNPSVNYLIGDQVDLYTLHIIREDSQQLFSFENLEDRNGIEQLLKVDGVGPKTAAMIVYTLSWPVIIGAIRDEDFKTLSTVKGLGAKTAKKIVLELKGATTDISKLEEKPEDRAEFDKIITAVVAMGYKKTEVQSVLNKLSSHTMFDASNTVAAIRSVLRELS